MAVLSRLPNELILLTVEHACRGFNYTQPAWVASLCLVCKSVQLTVVPILYARLFISAKTMDAFEELALTDRNGRLSLVHEVHFDDSIPYRNPGPDGGCIVYRGITSTLARALTGVHSVCGPAWSLERLAHLNPDLSLKISSLYVNDLALYWPLLGTSKCFSALLGSVTHLHIIESFTSLGNVIESLEPLQDSGFVLHSLTFDIILDDDDIIGINALDITRVHASLDSVMAMLSGCRRVLFRPRCESPDGVQIVIAQLTGWAGRRKDARVWVDDAFVSIRDATTRQLWPSDLDVADVLAGDSLWERARPL